MIVLVVITTSIEQLSGHPFEDSLTI